MSWFPELKIGVWNAWILMLFYVLHPLIMIVIDKAIGTGDILKKMGDVPYTKREQSIFTITMIILLLLFAYSIFLPLNPGTAWFYIGLAVYIAGLVMFFTAIVNIATTPLGQLFSKGVYRYSRHPLMFSGSVAFVGVSICSSSILFLLVSVVIMVLQINQAITEERGCLETFGDEYQFYMNRTPRWIGKPRS